MNRWLIAGGLRVATGDEGDLWYRDADGNLVHLPIPADHATVDYVLGIVAGLPAWIAAGDLIGSSDYTWVQMTTIDETGATVLMTDDDGSPILTYIPVP